NDNWRSYRTSYTTGTGSSAEEALSLHDDTLAPGAERQVEVKPGYTLWLLPVVGSVIISTYDREHTTVGAGESWWAETNTGKIFTLLNPFRDCLVNYLLLWVRTEPARCGTFTSSFHLMQPKNRWHTIINKKGMTAKLTMLEGRKEITYRPAAGLGAFLFVIQGAFEASGRLLQPRDALVLYEEEIEIEALSQDAICLLLVS
ncbi:MAG TPA: hypothetical protein PKC69_14305, partial [Chitinophagaceae bacterium]|nr:hypothetical protein [Chitinophagaceae bacterium]